MASQLNDPNFGSQRNSDTYGQTRETIGSGAARRLESQIKRDQKRGRLSERTKSAIATQALEEFAQSIAQQKISQVQQSLENDSRSKSNQPEISVETTVSQETTPSSSKIAPSVPQDLPSFMIDVCNNGVVARYRVYGGRDL